MNRNSLFHLSIFTLFGFSLIAYIILHFNKKVEFWTILSIHNITINAILIGLGVGILAAALGFGLIQILPDSKMNNMLDGAMEKLNPQWYHIVFYSFCAGVGEEILFRGAIQSYIQLWPTAIIFVFIHGYLNIKDKTMFIYGVFLVFISGGFGYLHKYLGIYAAISAHFIYDVIMFAYMKKKG